MEDIWNYVAPAWAEQDAWIAAHLRPATDAMLTAAGISAGSDVLDLATGAGAAGRAAAALAGPSGTVVLADVAPAMVNVAAERARGLPGVTTLVCDQTNIPVDDESFDAVICRHGLMFADDPAAAVREALRVLRPDGRYVAMVWGQRANNPWLGSIFDAVGAQFGVEIPPPGLPGPFSLQEPDDLQAALTDGGLQGVTVQELRAPLKTSTLEAWWTSTTAIAGPVASALEAMDPRVRAEIRDRALALAASNARATDDGFTLDGSVLIASGRHISRF